MNLVALLLLTLHLFIVSFVDAGQVVLMVSDITRSFDDMEADFSPPVKAMVETGVVYVAEPLDACQRLRNKPEKSPNGTSPFVLIVRGSCSFEYKVRNAQRSGFKAAIVYDDVDRNVLFAMAGDSDGIKIQAVFVTKATGESLRKYAGLAETEVMLVFSSEEDSVWPLSATIASILSFAFFGVLTVCVIYRHCTTHRNSTSQFHGMSCSMVKAMPSITFSSAEEENSTGFSCAICLEDYIVGDKLRVLPCSHKFHAVCVDSWLTSWRTFCPVCKRDARISSDEPPTSEITPLVRSSTATSSIVFIDPPPLGSSVSFSPGHASSPYFLPIFRSSSHCSHYFPIDEDLRQEASALHSSSQRSYISCLKSLHSLGYSNMCPLNAIERSPYRTNPIIALPGLISSANHPYHPCLTIIQQIHTHL